MRGVETRIQEIRHRIFREIARMAYGSAFLIASLKAIEPAILNAISEESTS